MAKMEEFAGFTNTTHTTRRQTRGRTDARIEANLRKHCRLALLHELPGVYFFSDLSAFAIVDSLPFFSTLLSFSLLPPSSGVFCSVVD